MATSEPIKHSPRTIPPSSGRIPHENVASALRKKAVLANLMANKEDSNSPGHKFKTPLRPVSEALNAASSGKKLSDRAAKDAPIKRTQSAQNIPTASENSGTGVSPGSGNTGPNSMRNSSTVKRTTSSQNVSSVGGGGGGSRGGVGNRTTSTVMAYNAELLANFEREKKGLERRISELIQVAETRRVETEKLKFALKNVREQQMLSGTSCAPRSVSNSTSSAVDEMESDLTQLQDELDSLREENHQLREKLQQISAGRIRLSGDEGHFTDTEKLAFRCHSNSAERERTGSGAEVSVLLDDVNVPSLEAAEGTKCAGQSQRSDYVDLDFGLTPEGDSRGDLVGSVSGGGAGSLDCNWDRQSTKSDGGCSEVSVACLQDRILQMEETHYSTSEELQATLQELADLQDAVNELSCENDRLADEKHVLLESLCAQTEKLENARLQVEHLKALLLRDLDMGGRSSDNEQQLLSLLRGVEEEREELLLKQVELTNQVEAIDCDRRDLQTVVTQLRSRIQLQDGTEGGQQFVDPSQISLTPGGGSGSASVPDVALTSQARPRACDEELAMLLKQLHAAQQELSVYRARVGDVSDLDELERRFKEVEGERDVALENLEGSRQELEEVRVAYEQLVEERLTNKHVLAALESELRMSRQKISSLDTELQELSIRHITEQDEWRQFRTDLQTAVVIANEIKTEAEKDMENVLDENQQLKDQITVLTAERDFARLEMEKLRQAQQRAIEPPSLVNRDEIRGKVISTVDRELANVRRQAGGSGNNSSLSVRHLISSIEEQVKNERSPPSSSAVDSPTTPSSQSILSPTLLSPTNISAYIPPPTTTTAPNSVKSSPTRRGLVSAGNGSSGVVLNSPTFETSLSSMRTSPAMNAGANVSRISPLHKARPLNTAAAVSDDAKQPAAARIPTGGVASSVIGMSAGQESVVSNLIGVTAGQGANSGGGINKENAENGGVKKPLTGILTNKSTGRRSGISTHTGFDTVDKASSDKTNLSVIGGNGSSGNIGGGLSHPAGLGKADPLAHLAKQLGGSKRNALLKWCQNRTATYPGIDITNFSSSWNDGLAFCALLHTYLPDKIPYKELKPHEKMKNFTIAFKAAESVNINSSLDVKEMIATERPDWQIVMSYVTSIYKHFDIDSKIV